MAYAAFISRHKFEDFVRLYIERLGMASAPLLAKLSHITRQRLEDITRVSLESFIHGMADGSSYALAAEGFARWSQNKLGLLSRAEVNLGDILGTYHVQKASLLSFLPFYTNSTSECIRLALDIEQYYHTVQTMAVEILKNIEQEEIAKAKEVDEKYRDLLDNANDLVHLLMPDGAIIYVNNAWKNTLGYTGEELEGKLIYDYIAHKDRENYFEYRQRAMAGEAQEPRTFTFLAKNGVLTTLEGSINCKFKNGQPEYTRCIFRDITTRLSAEAELQFYAEQLLEQKEKLAALIQNAPDAVIVINERGAIELWNPIAEEIFGWAEHEMRGALLADTIIPPRYRDAHSGGMLRYLTTGETRVLNKTIEITALKKNGEEFYVALNISKVSQRGGTNFIAFVRDIQVQKQNERQLIEQHKELEQTNFELEQYAFLAAHDLKEPIRKILVFSDLLLDGHKSGLQEKVDSYLPKIHASARQAGHMVDDLVSYASLNAAHMATEPVHISQIVGEVLLEYNHIIQLKSAHISLGDLPTVAGNGPHVKTLFGNLIGNALKFNKEGTPPVIKISSQQTAGRCIIQIEDNGIGFGMEHATKIFQIFKRLVQRDKYDGTGVGLAICKKIAKNHGGRIWAESTEDRGSIFFVELPLYQVI